MTGSILTIVAQVAVVLTSTGVLQSSDGTQINCGQTTTKTAIEGYYLGGFYNKDEINKVYICTQVRVEDLEHIRYHEIAHYFHFQKVPAYQMAKWIRVSNAIRSKSAFVSTYAMQDPHEDFSETFAFIAQGKKPELSQIVLRQKIAFLKYLIRTYGN